MPYQAQLDYGGNVVKRNAEAVWNLLYARGVRKLHLDIPGDDRWQAAVAVERETGGREDLTTADLRELVAPEYDALGVLNVLLMVIGSGRWTVDLVHGEMAHVALAVRNWSTSQWGFSALPPEEQRFYLLPRLPFFQHLEYEEV